MVLLDISLQRVRRERAVWRGLRLVFQEFGLRREGEVPKGVQAGQVGGRADPGAGQLVAVEQVVPQDRFQHALEAGELDPFQG